MANNDASEWKLFDTDLVTVLGILPASESHLYLVLNEPGSGELKIPIASALANGMTSGMFAQCSYRGEVRGGFFVENMSEGQADASEYSGQWLSISGRGALSLLDDAIVWSGGSTDSTRDFAGMSKAEILITLIIEAQARGALLNLSYDFSATLDSRGEAWIDSDTPPLTVGKSLLDVARDFAKAGIDFDITPNAGDFILSAYKSARGSDKSNTVYFRIGLSCKELTSDERVDKIKNALLVAYKSGYISVQDDDSISARRRRERLLDLKAAQTASSATTIGAAEVALYKDPKRGIVVKVDDSAGPRIFVDYDLGDYIQLDNAGVENRYRILGMQPNWVNGKYSDVALELNSLFNDNDIEMSQDIDWLMEQINTANDAGLIEVSYWAAIGEPVVTAVTGLHIVGNKLYFIGTGEAFYSYDIGTGEWIDTPIDIGNNPLCITSVGTDLYIGCFHAVYKYDTSTKTLTNIGVVSFSASPSSERVTAIGAIGTVVYVAGVFEDINGISITGMAQYDTIAELWSSWGTSGWSGSFAPAKILTNGADLYMGGGLSSIDGVAVSNIGHWDGASWDDMGGGLDATVFAIAVYGTNILAGGGFTGHIAEWDGASWTVFGGGLSGLVTDIAVYLTDVYAVGNFTAEGNYITKYSGGVWWQLRDGVNDVINKIALYNDDVYVAGEFTQADGKDAPRVAVYFTNFESLLDYLDNSGSFNMGAAIHNAPAAALTNASEIPFWDAVTTKLRKITWLNMWLTIKALADLVYVPLAQTANRILVSNGSGSVTTDAALAFDATTKQLQIGTPNSTSGEYAIIQGKDGASVFHIMEVYGSGATISPFLNGIRGEGTAAAPTALSAGKYMLRLRGSAYDGPGSYGGTSAEVRFVTSENHTPSAHGAKIEIYVTPIGSTTLTKVVTIGDDGIIYDGAGNPYLTAAGVTGGASTFAQNSGNTVNDASTFDGYTISQIAKALRDIGVLP